MASLFIQGRCGINICNSVRSVTPSVALGFYYDTVRWASKKTGGSTKNQKGHGRPKHRGWRVQDGHYVQAGTILATQLNLRFHPGLNVGLGRNGTLFAIERGKVLVTCEKLEPNWDHSWVKKNYEGRENQTIYKKFFNVINESQDVKFRLITSV